MRIVKQMVLTVYADGSTKCTERAQADRGSDGRYIRKHKPEDLGPMLPGLEKEGNK